MSTRLRAAGPRRSRSSPSPLPPVELSHDEPVEALVVGAAMGAQEPERLLLADEEAAYAVGAVVDAGGVAAERDVVGELVDLVAESGTPPEFPGRAVRRGLDRMRQWLRRWSL